MIGFRPCDFGSPFNEAHKIALNASSRLKPVSLASGYMLQAKLSDAFVHDHSCQFFVSWQLQYVYMLSAFA